jgi:prophage regulatory protein
MDNLLSGVHETCLDRRDLEQITRLRRTAIFERMNPKSRYFDPSFPKPFQIGSGPNSKRWLRSEIMTWLAAKVDQSRAAIQPDRTSNGA